MGSIPGLGQTSGRRASVICGHAQRPEPADDVRVIDLAGVVEAVAGVRVDVGGFENADVVIVPQRFSAQA